MERRQASALRFSALPRPSLPSPASGRGKRGKGAEVGRHVCRRSASFFVRMILIRKPDATFRDHACRRRVEKKEVARIQRPAFARWASYGAIQVAPKRGARRRKRKSGIAKWRNREWRMESGFHSIRYSPLATRSSSKTRAHQKRAAGTLSPAHPPPRSGTERGRGTMRPAFARSASYGVV